MSSPMLNILWHIDPFLGNDHETNNKTTAIARQEILTNYLTGDWMSDLPAH
jgi:hypothetical protein